jgi:hypothetical protein
LEQRGGYLQTLVPIDDLSPETAYEAAQRAAMLGFATTPARSGANGLPINLFDVRITPAGQRHLQQHRRTSPHLVIPAAPPAQHLDTSLAARTARRNQFMTTVYEESECSESNVMNGFSIGTGLGWPYQETSDVMQYWEGERLIHFVAEEGAIVITHRGIVEVEGARNNPAQPTQHFPPYSVIFQGDVTNSPVQIGTVDSTQTVITKTGMSDELLTEFLAAVEAAMALAPLTQTANSDVAEMIGEVRAQLERPEPNTAWIKAPVNAPREITIGMAASGGWALAVELAHKLA